MAWLDVRPYTFHRDWNDIEKTEGRFTGVGYAADAQATPYDLTHRVEWAPSVANGTLGNPLDPYQEYTMVKNMGTDPVYLYHNVWSNWPNDPINIVILPGHWVEVVDLDTTTQPRIWVDSALYSSPMECEVLQVGYQSWEEEEPEEYCDMWAVGHIPQDGCGFKHYPEAGNWLTIASTITDADHWLADVAGVDVADYWAVGYETDVGVPIAGLVAQYGGVAWAEVAVADDPPFYGCWGFAANDYWAVGGTGAQGEIWHYNGVAWTAHTLPDQDARDIYCIHGSAAVLAYCAGEDAFIADWDNVVWTVHAVSPEMEGFHFYGTWNSATPNAWVCGGDAVWWGASGGNGIIMIEAPPSSGLWQSYSLPQGCPTLRAMWGFADNNIWAVGDQGWILHFNGFVWTQVAEPAELGGNYDYRGVFGCYPYSVWAIGTTQAGDNVIIHWDGVQWTVNHGPNADEMDLLGLKGVEVVP
jgi:hypothetical protein